MQQTAQLDISRPLGGMEKLFWLLDESRWTHFAIAGQLVGTVPLAVWNEKLNGLALASSRVWDTIVRDENGLPIFLKGVPGTLSFDVIRGGVEDLPDQLSGQLTTPFNTKAAPLMRAVLMEEEGRSIVILAAHHSIADGLSLVHFLRDLLSEVSGSPRKTTPEYRSMEQIAADNISPAKLPTMQPGPFPRGPISYRDKTTYRPMVECAGLTLEESSALRERARAEQTTVHSAMSAALVAVFKGSLVSEDGGPLRVFSPLDVRRRLLKNSEHLGTGVSGATVADDETVTDLWAKARHFSAGLGPSKSIQGISATVGTIEVVMSQISTSEDASAMFAMVVGAEIMLTNMGNLSVPQVYGPLFLEAIWGPCATVGFAGEQSFGVATLGGRINIVYAGQEAHRGILSRLKDQLAFMIGR